MLNKNTILVGLGLHAKRIYMHYFKKYKFEPELIIELKSRRKDVLRYCLEHGLKSELFFVDDDVKYSFKLAATEIKELDSIIKSKNITHAIISTEPRAHYKYLLYFLAKNIKILCDKPITVVDNVSNDLKAVNKLMLQYSTLKVLDTENKITVQCQRRYHPGYIFIKKLITETLDKYKIPVSYIDIYHSDGQWNMPEEYLTRENHSYKYGFGKLFHSGYHFVDLLSWLIEQNIAFIKTFETYSTTFKPIDHLNMFNYQDYENLFKTKLKKSVDRTDLSKCGELDSHSLIQLKDYAGNSITTASLNLMQTGVSRRSWLKLPEDTYKGNGRIRHERVNINIGNIMNIQVHSYQSKEIKDRKNNDNTCVGDIEHFDIYIFRNKDLIGGKEFEKITLNELAGDKTNCFIGFNELSREKCLDEFYSDSKINSSCLKDHEFSMDLLESILKSQIKNKIIKVKL